LRFNYCRDVTNYPDAIFFGKFVERRCFS